MMMITPTVGRVVWFWPPKHLLEGFTAQGFTAHPDQPCAATVAYVFGDRMVNLQVTDHNGVVHSRTSVPLLQEDDNRPSIGYFCEWMPYQKGQAAKTEAVEKNAFELGAAARAAGIVR